MPNGPTFHALGVNHQTAPVSMRERLAFDAGALPAALAALRAVPGVHEAAILSTCNRTELYAVAEGDGAMLRDWLATRPGERLALEAYLYRHQDVEAVRHLFRVAAGLDSLVLGEPQILGQVKEAWATARGAGTLGSRLDRMFQQAFGTAKHARTHTRIGQHPVSVASTAVRLAQDTFARLEDSTVLLIGAGETIELTAKHLSDGRVKRLLIANRTLAHAQDIAGRHGGFALPLTELDRHLAEADIVFSATAAREPILHRAQVAAALRARRHRPMLLLDLAVPRDIEAAIGELADVFLYTVDDLERAVEENRQSRRAAAEEAEAIATLHAERFMERVAVARNDAPVRRLRAHGQLARDEAMRKAQRLLAGGGDPQAALDLLAHTLTNRLLHAPTIALRDAAATGDAELARAVDRLFPPLSEAETDASDAPPQA
ncbi:glutamyl-tRNA reductase [Lysobacter pythonis]|uniref:Glutamyl-tRNA reductase n=1 Tax=Solilutibacter pythonis TaxID=2483112 RepID=A0A3M2HNJ8_9GAMM|nr:glutamyl-tRNA reductase [Lysobacter pythonis]RMH89483.1 glutamyl-tRNA reductase [Lysobacter pythonis]